MGEGLSRRDLLRGAGAGLLAVGASGLLEACSGGEQGSNNSTVSPSPSHNGFQIPAFAISVDTLTRLSESEIYERFGLVTRMGGRRIRVDFDGNLANESKPGNYDWSITDKIMMATRRRNLGVTALFTAVNPVDQIPGARAHNDYNGRPTLQGMHNLAAFVGASLRRYDKKEFPNFDRGEGWNEWNISGGGARPAEYLHMYRLMREQALDANPDFQFAIGGLAPSYTEDGAYSPADAIDALFGEGLTGAEVQAVAHHPYEQTVIPTPGEAIRFTSWGAFSQIENGPNSIYSVLKKHGIRGTPLWITEYGAASWPEVYGRHPDGSILATPQDQKNDAYNSERDFVTPDLQFLMIRAMLSYKFRNANVPYDMRHVYTSRDRAGASDSSPYSHYGVYDIHDHPKDPRYLQLAA